MVVPGLLAVLLVAGGLVPAPAQGTVATSIDPNTVRLEQYSGNGQTLIWGYPYQSTVPGGPCANVALPDDASQGERSRLFALFLTAKAAHKPVVLHYDETTCRILSFAADGW